MNTPINKAKTLMSSPAGCAVLLDIASNPDTSLEHFAEPLMSFWLTSNAMDWCDIHHESNAQALALMAAQDKLELALRIAEHPAFTWWYEPLDLTAQIWVSPQWPGHRKLFPDAYERFAPESLAHAQRARIGTAYRRTANVDLARGHHIPNHRLCALFSEPRCRLPTAGMATRVPRVASRAGDQPTIGLA